MIIETMKSEMEKTISNCRKELSRIQTGRASTQILDRLKVQYYDEPVPLYQLAQLSTPDARLLVVRPYDPAALPAIERAIQTSSLGLNPSSDGEVIRIAFPPLVERRAAVLRQLKKCIETHRVGIRTARRKGVTAAKAILSSDEKFLVNRRVQETTDRYISQLEDMASSKEAEILSS